MFYYEDNLVFKFIFKMMFYLENFSSNFKEVFDVYEECLFKYDYYIKNGFEDIEIKGNLFRYMIIYIVLKVFKYNGIQLDYYRCISCNLLVNLVDFKFFEDGFICGQCIDN